MCYSAPISFITFILGILIACQLYQRNRGSDRWIALFVVSFILMQLLEGIIWVYKDNNLQIPSIMSYAILFVLICQPLVQTFGLLTTKSTNKMFNKNVKNLMKWGLVIVTIIGILNMFNLSPQKIDIGKCGHLKWNLTFKFEKLHEIFLIFYFIFMSIPLLFMKPLSRGIILLLYGIISLLLIQFVYNCKEFSSMWCFIAIIYGLIAFLT